MRILAGILLLAAGVICPMAMLFRVNSLLSRKPPPAARRVGLLIALNGVLPIGLIISGLGLLSPKVWASPVPRTASVTALIVAVVLLIVLAATSRHPADKRTGGDNGR